MANKTYLAGFAAAGLMAGVLAVATLSFPVSAKQTDDSRVAAPKAPPRCLDGRNIGRKHVIDENTLLVYDTWGNPYKLDIGGPCRSMDDFSQIGFEFEGSDQICGAHDAKILYSHHGERPVKCLINGVTPISRAEAAELDK